MYQVKFEDNTEFKGGHPDNSLWDQLPNKPIKSITYWVTDDLKYEFSNFEEYCHCVEHIQGVNNPLQIVSKAIIMGKTGQRVYQIIFDLKRGHIYQIAVPYGQEYSPQERLGECGGFVGWQRGQPIGGWKNGILNAEYPGPKLKKITATLGIPNE